MRHQKGFTLFELILAITLISLGVMAVISAISSGVVADSTLDGQVTALKLAQEEIETAKNTTYSNLSSLDGSSSMSPNFPDYTRIVVVTIPTTGLTQVTVTVGWDFKSSPMTVSLVTLIADTT
jgi:prepilin-type N-terminal cleavage/methylation domain-containing protein